METASSETDKRLGITILLTVVTLVGAIVLLARPGTSSGAYGFALVVTGGTLLVIGLHGYA